MESKRLVGQKKPTNDKTFLQQWGLAILLLSLFVAAFTAMGGLRSTGVWLGAMAIGIAMSLVAVGVYLTFRILNFPDLTIDGSFVLGGSITATLLVAEYSPYVTLPAAFALAAIAGACTGFIATRLRIHSLLASIITATALYSINLRIMGKSNIPLLNTPNLLTPIVQPFRSLITATLGEGSLRYTNSLLTILFIGLLVLVIKWGMDWFLRTEVGLGLRSTGDNPSMMRSLGRNTDTYLILGVALSNGLTGLAGAMYVQYQGFSDVNMGLGLIIAGLAAVILGETLLRPTTIGRATLSAILGMIVYRVAIAVALSVKFPLPTGDFFRIEAQDVKLATALLVLVTLWVTQFQSKQGTT